MDQEVIKDIIRKVITKYLSCSPVIIHPQSLPAGVSNRHVHLSESDMEKLFGKGYVLDKKRDLSQTGQFSSVETVNIAGPKGCIERVRVLGPIRKQTQIEIAGSDSYKLGVSAPVRESGNLKGSPGITVIGPKGSVNLKEGLIIAKRHIHMTPKDAQIYGVKDGENVQVRTCGGRSLIFDQVVIRVSDKFVLEFHIDMDEANASGIKHGECVNIVTCGVSGNSGIQQRDMVNTVRVDNDIQALSLVTEDTVRKASKSKISLKICPKAIITPLAKDAIKELNVDVVSL